MKKRALLLSAVSFLLFFPFYIFSQSTPGTLSFSVTTVTLNGTYKPKHIMAVWIENESGQFIKTKIKYGYSYLQYLNVWKTKSNSNVVDAITGATKTSHGTRTFIWNGTDVSGNVVSDGTYKVWLQMTESNANGPTYSCSFIKSTTPITNQTYSNSGAYTNLTLSWTPSTTGASENTFNESKVLISPNPFSTEVRIEYQTEKTDFVELAVFDLQGKKIKELFSGTQNQGEHTISWNGKNNVNQNLTAGIYFCRIIIGDNILIKRILKL
ncbi:MAG: hypothetical protein A2275_00025 [Bacteroidetes bacterium RIFOXYA12_FULL_35_11]|nr:MAG: hypothetical protein A2X01_06735 [Bacteroidetes bacterium GWF2_35_48]OFY81137.1 MAG: hypothetical protein A2275_00025 [Bacteroidetes bacterium RIFOXYA12_FULL_35_11]OFY95909.1 MAG: hypothetical protein A2491_10205 [Bacteroidetes bacterium RIFOXYC12_FULL_35_7]HBX49765.1 hypothetical protein [Bacteroidales bacterium]